MIDSTRLDRIIASVVILICAGGVAILAVAIGGV